MSDSVLLVPLFFFIPMVVLFIRTVVRGRAGARKTVARLKKSDGFVGAHVSFFGEIIADFKKANFTCTVQPDSSDNGRYWKVTVTGVRVGATTPFMLSKENFLSEVVSKLGFADIQIGHAAFDAAYRISGRDEDRIRGLLQFPEVRRGLHRVAVAKGFGGLAVRDDETLVFRAPRKGVEEVEIRDAAKVGLQLAAVLDAHLDAEPLVEVPALDPVQAVQAVPTLQSVSGGSGAPVALGSRTDA